MLPILCHSLFCFCFYFPQEERLLRMGDELSRLASYEAECHRKDGVIEALRDEVVDQGSTSVKWQFQVHLLLLVST